MTGSHGTVIPLHSARRGDAGPEPIVLAREPAIRIGSLVIDPGRRLLRHGDGREEIVQPRVMQVLVALLKADGAIVTRDDLLACCWGGRIVGEDAINRTILKCRRLAASAYNAPFTIETIPKVGFRLVLAPGIHAEAAPGSAGGETRWNWLRRGRIRWTAAAALVASLTFAGILGLSTSVADVPPAQQSPQPVSSIAVLPFSDHSPGAANAWFGEGVAEEIIGQLANEPGLRVIGRTSIAMLGSNAGLGEARSRLGVTHVLEGSVRKSGDRLRVSARLIDARNGRHLWAEDFDRPVGDIFAIQDEIGAQVASRLIGTLSSGSRPVALRTSPEVYDLYLAALSLERDETHASSLEAKRLLERAVQLDPNYAPALARLAIYARIAWSPGGPERGASPIVDPAKGIALARRAVTLAPGLGDAHAALGVLFESDADWRRAVPHLQRAVELDPGNYLGWETLGRIQAFRQCRFDEAENSFRRASAIEPLIASPHYNLVGLAGLRGDSAEALRLTRRFAAISRDRTHLPKFWRTIAMDAGDLSDAAAAGEQAKALDPDNWTLAFGNAGILRALGLRSEAASQFPQFGRSIAAPLLQGDSTAAAAAAIEGGDQVWRFGPAMRSIVTNALLADGRDSSLIQLFDRNYGSVDELARQLDCRQMLYVGPPLVLAMRRTNRNDEAERLRRITDERFRQWADSGYLTGADRHLLQARQLMLRGQRDAALDALGRAAAAGWVDQNWPFFGLHERLFDPVRSNPRFRAIEQRIAAKAARERKELASRGS